MSEPWKNYKSRVKWIPSKEIQPVEQQKVMIPIRPEKKEVYDVGWQPPYSNEGFGPLMGLMETVDRLSSGPIRAGLQGMAQQGMRGLSEAGQVLNPDYQVPTGESALKQLGVSQEEVPLQMYGTFGNKVEMGDAPTFTPAQVGGFGVESLDPSSFVPMAGMFMGPKAKGFAKAGRKFSALWDKRPRFEISDAKSALDEVAESVITKKSDFSMNSKLGDVLNHDDLYENYPDLKDIQVSYRYGEGEPSGSLGVFTNGEIELTVNAETPEDMKRVLLHEVQHYIQKEEGFALGGSTGFSDRMSSEAQDKLAYKRYFNKAGEVESRDTEARMMMDEAERAKTQPLSSQDIDEPHFYAEGMTQNTPEIGELSRKTWDHLGSGFFGDVLKYDIKPGEKETDFLRRKIQEIADHNKEYPDSFYYSDGYTEGRLKKRLGELQETNMVIESSPMQSLPLTVKNKPKRVASWFSGTGTVEAGLGKGAKSVHAVEYQPEIMEQFNKVHGTNYKPRDVANINPDEIIKSKPDIFHASPVCKNFSKAKTVRGADELDRKSAESISKVIREAQPPTVTIENVPAYKETALFDMITKELDAAGYKWDVNDIDAADYGGNQIRKRMILRATKEGELPELPQKTGPSDWYESVADLVDDAEDSVVPPWEMKRLKSMVERGSLDPNKPIITMGGSAGKSVASARNAGGPSPTLKATPNEVPRILMPDGRQKRVTPRMMARLMGMPDDMKIPKTHKLSKTVLGNGIHGSVSRNFIKPLTEKPSGPWNNYKSRSN